jgi:NADH dehydrogenase [ubiquinone] 1 alpha subcomplex assembly factor 7
VNALAQEIAALIAADGPISLEHFMTLALQHPRLGYYRTRQPIGADGDFITAPEIHQMFGELIGLWAIEVWQQMGEPSRVHLVELGPGRGTLMADVLRVANLRPAFLRAAQIQLVEASEALFAVQRQTLAAAAVARPITWPVTWPITWHRAIEDLPDGPAIVLANEFFDALPIRQFARTEQGLCERVVGLGADGELCFGLVPTGAPPTAARAAHGAIIEIGAAAQSVARRLAARFAASPGALLAIDYGYSRPSAGATLQALRRHSPDDPLRAPGEADLTAHVDFSALARAAQAEGAAVYGPIGQGKFLARLGIFERAAALKRNAAPAQSAAIDAALARLALPGPESGPKASMAELFKVLAITSPDLPAPPGLDRPAGQDQ